MAPVIITFYLHCTQQMTPSYPPTWLMTQTSYPPYTASRSSLTRLLAMVQLWCCSSAVQEEGHAQQEHQGGDALPYASTTGMPAGHNKICGRHLACSVSMCGPSLHVTRHAARQSRTPL
jgi:hypothetical protein